MWELLEIIVVEKKGWFDEEKDGVEAIVEKCSIWVFSLLYIYIQFLLLLFVYCVIYNILQLFVNTFILYFVYCDI